MRQANAKGKTISAESFQIEITVSGKAPLEIMNQSEFDFCLIDIRTPLTRQGK
jgi:hypothetical protein